MNLKLIAILALTTGVIAGLGYSYHLGVKNTELQYQNQAKEQQLRDYQKLQYVESQAQQTQINNDKKYEELNNELLQTTNNLRSCRLNTSSVRIIYKSAMQNATSESTNDDATSGITTNSESGLTAQDITLTLINHDHAYFDCKAVVDSWQEWYKTMSENK